MTAEMWELTRLMAIWMAVIAVICFIFLRID